MATTIEIPTLRHLIAGQFQESADDRYFPSLDPSAAGEVVARVPVGSVDDVAHAVDAASAALPGWRRLSGPARAEYLHAWAAAIDARREELARAVVREVGKPLGEARGEVARCVVILRYYAGEAVRGVGEVIPAQGEGMLQFTLREPLGVFALITPWNFPLAIPLWKAAPALAFGNTVVLKPAEESSHVASLLAETAVTAGLPAGVFNLLLGEGGVVGEALVRAEAVRGISFTGSTGVGARVAALAAERNVRYQTEMGGKNVVIVAEDADLAAAARLTAAGAMRYAGQKCTATSRAIVLRGVEDRFLEHLRAEVSSLSLGPVDEIDSAVGPLITEASLDRVRRILAGASGELIQGGGSPADPRLAAGNYIEPAIVRGVDPDSAIAQDEIFGPVLAMMVADDLEEAIDLANRTHYGLSASLFTRDLRSVLGYIDRIEVGLVRVNGDTTGVDPHAPFGGFKASSSGSREQGPAAREFYTEIKTVQVQG